MTYRMALHHRRSIRLRGYDYRQAGAYFVTICTQDRACLLGEVVDGAVRLNEAGAMVQAIWEAIPAHYPGVMVDEFVAMPNHVHGIIVLPGVVHARQLEGQAQGPAPTNMGGDVASGTGGDNHGTNDDNHGTNDDNHGTNDDTATAGGDNHGTGTLAARAAGQAQGPAPTNIGGDVVAGTGGIESAPNDDTATSGGDNRGPGTIDVGAAPCGRPVGPHDNLGALVAGAGQAQGPAPTNMGREVAAGTGGDNHATNDGTATCGGGNHATTDDNHGPGTIDVGAAPCGRPDGRHHNLAVLPAGAAGQAKGPAPTNMGGDVASGTGGDKPATNDDNHGPGTIDVGAAPCGRPVGPHDNLGALVAGAGQAQGPAPTNMGGDVAAGTGGDNHGTGSLGVGAAPCGRPVDRPHNVGALPARASGQARGPAPTNMGGDVVAGSGGDKPATNDDNHGPGTIDVGAARCGRPVGPHDNLGALVAGAGQAQGPAPTNMGGDVAAGSGGDNHPTNDDTATSGGGNHGPGTIDVGAAPCGRPDGRDHNRGDLSARAAGQAQGPAPTNIGGDVVAGSGGDNHPTNDDTAGTGGDNNATGTSDVGAAPCGRPPLSPMSVGDIMQRFKSLTTRRYSDGVRESAWPEFRGRLWQRNYHEHIIRNEADLNRIRLYIRDNPAQWAFDSEYLADGAGPRQAKR